MQETQVRSLGWEDPLEDELANHFCILAWRILWTEEPGQLQYYICKSQLIIFFLMFGTFHECTCQQYEEQVVEWKKHIKLCLMVVNSILFERERQIFLL